MTARTAPSSTFSPSRTRSSASRPDTGASTGISIFIDSRMRMTSSARTASPTVFSIFHTFPVICASTAVGMLPPWAAECTPVLYPATMLETLSAGFTRARERLAGVQTLSDTNLDEALADVRRSLLEADVDYGVAKDFLARVREKSLGARVETKVRDAAGRVHRVTPGQHFVASCEEELAALMGPVDPTLARADGAVSVLLLGLQGVGKTTAAAKLARLLQKQGRRPLLVAADVQRPAAVQQLQTLGASIGVPVHAGEPGEAPPTLCARARARARQEGFDAIVYDTAGRLAIDGELMAELRAVDAATSPANRLLVCDALMGR